PAVAAVAIVGFFLAMRFESGGDAVSLAGINIADKSLVMNAPHISGFEGTRSAYEVKAARATQDLKNPKIVTLDDIDARFGLDGTSTATLNAKQGVFNADTNLLVLQNGITISTSDGYSGTLRDAHVDIGKGTLSSANPIEIRSDAGSLRANSIDIADRGKRVKFSGGVSVSFVPPPDAFAPPGSAPAAGLPAPPEPLPEEPQPDTQ